MEISNIKIAVGGTDAAKTAITYGITVQSVEYLLAILSEITNVKRYRKSVNISADFTADLEAFERNPRLDGVKIGLPKE